MSPGSPQGFVNDFAGLIPDDQETILERQLQDFEKKTTHEISVLTIQSLQGDSLEAYSTALAREWGIGKKDADNGVLFLVASEERKMRIEVGYGLEGALTDLETQYIQKDFAVPFFQKGEFAQGISAASGKIMEAIESELVPGSSQARLPFKLSGSMIETMLLFIIFFISWFISIFARTKSWWLGGLVGSGIGAIIAFITAAWFWIFVSMIIGLALDYVVSKNYRAHPDHPAWWAGGAWHGWDRWGGGGGFGGFGGGSSGGGGSSSGW